MLIRHQFCGDMDDKKWFSMIDWFLRYVVLWPARFVVKKGFLISGERYEQIMRSIFMDIKRMGNTAIVKDWPVYLLKCVQDHWHHHWEEYYQESKSAHNLTQLALVAAGKLPAPVDTTVERLAEAQALLSRRQKSRRQAKSEAQIGPV